MEAGGVLEATKDIHTHSAQPSTTVDDAHVAMESSRLKSNCTNRECFAAVWTLVKVGAVVLAPVLF